MTCWTICFLVMAENDRHVFQVLTKRPGRAVGWYGRQAVMVTQYRRPHWPAHIHIGTSIENQKYVPRVDVMARLPAAVKFVSAEPLLGPVDLSDKLQRGKVDWVIVGGESGPRARPMNLDWARALRDQCVAADVPFFLKQLGGRDRKRGGPEAVLDGQTWTQFPTGLGSE